MEQAVWFMLTVLACAATGATLFSEADDILFGFIGAVLWGFWAWSATHIEIITACCRHVESYTGLAWIGAGIAALNLLMMLAGSITVLDPRENNVVETDR